MLRLDPLSAPQDLPSLQRVLEQAPRYAEITTAAPVASGAAAEMFSALPPGKNHEDKFVLGVLHDDALIGCVDLIRGYPSPSIAYIGLLLIAEPHQGRGHGRAAFEAVQHVVASWRNCTTIRLGVLSSNGDARRFWSRLGFIATGEVKPYENGSVRTEVLLHERRLAAP